MIDLSNLCRIAGMALLRDAQVDSMGFIDVELEGRFVFATSERFAALANATPSIAAVLVSPDLARYEWRDGLGVATAPEPGRTFLDLHNHLSRETDFYGPRSASTIDPSASVHPRAHVDEVGVTIGPRCRVGPGAIVLEGSRLGEDVHVMSGAVIGSSGFQTMEFASGRADFDHAGSVDLERGTTVMANAVIARAVFKQATRVGEDCRIGNCAFVSHNCRIGAHSLLGHGTVIAGNVEIGAGVVVGPGATCINNICVGDGASITMGAVVTRSVASGQRVSGNFAVDHGTFVRALKSTVRCPDR